MEDRLNEYSFTNNPSINRLLEVNSSGPESTVRDSVMVGPFIAYNDNVTQDENSRLFSGNVGSVPVSAPSKAGEDVAEMIGSFIERNMYEKNKKSANFLAGAIDSLPFGPQLVGKVPIVRHVEDDAELDMGDQIMRGSGQGIGTLAQLLPIARATSALVRLVGSPASWLGKAGLGVIENALTLGGYEGAKAAIEGDENIASKTGSGIASGVMFGGAAEIGGAVAQAFRAGNGIKAIARAAGGFVPVAAQDISQNAPIAKTIADTIVFGALPAVQGAAGARVERSRRSEPDSPTMRRIRGEIYNPVPELESASTVNRGISARYETQKYNKDQFADDLLQGIISKPASKVKEVKQEEPPVETQKAETQPVAEESSNNVRDWIDSSLKDADSGKPTRTYQEWKQDRGIGRGDLLTNLRNRLSYERERAKNERSALSEGRRAAIERIEAQKAVEKSKLIEQKNAVEAKYKARLEELSAKHKKTLDSLKADNVNLETKRREDIAEIKRTHKNIDTIRKTVTGMMEMLPVSERGRYTRAIVNTKSVDRGAEIMLSAMNRLDVVRAKKMAETVDKIHTIISEKYPKLSNQYKADASALVRGVDIKSPEDAVAVLNGLKTLVRMHADEGKLIAENKSANVSAVQQTLLNSVTKKTSVALPGRAETVGNRVDRWLGKNEAGDIGIRNILDRYLGKFGLKYIYEPVNRAYAKEEIMSGDALRAVKREFEKTGKTTNDLYKIVNIDGEKFTGSALMEIYGLSRTQNGMDNLLATEGFDLAKVENILAKTPQWIKGLTDGLMNLMGSDGKLWKATQNTFYKVNGYTIEGLDNYYPLNEQEHLRDVPTQDTPLSAFNEVNRGLFKGFLEHRTRSSVPVKEFDGFKSVLKHMKATIKYASWADVVRDYNQLMKSNRFEVELGRKIGPERVMAMDNFMKDMSVGIDASKDSVTANLAQSFNRYGSAAVLNIANIPFIMEQPVAVMAALGRMKGFGVQDLAVSLAELMADPIAFHETVKSLSPTAANRAQTYSIQLARMSEHSGIVGRSGKVVESVLRSVPELMDRVSCDVAFMTAYKHAKRNNASDAEAIRFGEKVVEDSQGILLDKTRGEFYRRAKGLQKVFTIFTSWAQGTRNTMYQIRTEAMRGEYGAASRLALTTLLSAAFSAAIYQIFDVSNRTNVAYKFVKNLIGGHSIGRVGLWLSPFIDKALGGGAGNVGSSKLGFDGLQLLGNMVRKIVKQSD